MAVYFRNSRLVEILSAEVGRIYLTARESNEEDCCADGLTRRVTK